MFFYQKNLLKLFLTVDNKETLLDLQKLDTSLDLSKPLYIGGLKEDMYRTLPPTIASKDSFSGCLATMTVRGELKDLFRDGIHKTEFVSEGCTSK